MQEVSRQKDGERWLMVGSSPSVTSTLPAVTDRIGWRTVAAHGDVWTELVDTTVITCNSGIKLCCPDVFLCVDMNSGHWYGELAKAAQERGTRLVTLQRDARALRERNVDWYDEFLVLGNGPSRTQYGPFRYSGPLCVEYACMHGAKEVHLVGFDGYRKQDDYFDANDIPRGKLVNCFQTHTVDNLQPAMREIARVWHDVRFIQHGDPVFEVGADNWEVRRQ